MLRLIVPPWGYHFFNNLVLLRGSSSLAARQPHKLKVVGSNPTPATIFSHPCIYQYPYVELLDLCWGVRDPFSFTRTGSSVG